MARHLGFSRASLWTPQLVCHLRVSAGWGPGASGQPATPRPRKGLITVSLPPAGYRLECPLFPEGVARTTHDTDVNGPVEAGKGEVSVSECGHSRGRAGVFLPPAAAPDAGPASGFELWSIERGNGLGCDVPPEPEVTRRTDSRPCGCASRGCASSHGRVGTHAWLSPVSAPGGGVRAPASQDRATRTGRS